MRMNHAPRAGSLPPGEHHQQRVGRDDRVASASTVAPLPPDGQLIVKPDSPQCRQIRVLRLQVVEIAMTAELRHRDQEAHRGRVEAARRAPVRSKQRAQRHQHRPTGSPRTRAAPTDAVQHDQSDPAAFVTPADTSPPPVHGSSHPAPRIADACGGVDQERTCRPSLPGRAAVRRSCQASNSPTSRRLVDFAARHQRRLRQHEMKRRGIL